MLVGVVRDEDGGDDAQDVDGDGEELGVGGGVAEAEDDAGRGVGEAVEGDGVAPVDDDGEPDLPLHQRCADRRPVEQVLRLDVACLGARVRLQPPHEEAALRGAEEGRGFGAVGEECETRHADDDGRDAFEDEDPTPATEAGDAVHVLDGEGEEAGEGAGEGGGAEEDGHACLEFEALVPGREEVGACREEAGFCQAKLF